jgi:hypothetical protein
MSTNSATKLVVIKTKKHPFGGTKSWVRVELLRSRIFWPAFRDLHRVIQAIASCEDEKYPPPFKGRTRLAEFLHDAVYERDFDVLARKYKIPEREGDTIVNTNGAAIATPEPVSTEAHGPVLADEIRWGFK